MRGWTQESLAGLTEAQPSAATRMLDEMEKTPLRTNRGNDGREFQRELGVTSNGYQARGIATFRKVDPPTRVIWYEDKEEKKKKQRVIFMENPYLDFLGVWTGRHGRMLMIEAKSTATHRLPFKRHGGLTEEQIATARRWRMAGAATLILWKWTGRVTLWTPEMLAEAESRGDKSLLFENGLPVDAGAGVIRWDFLPVLAGAIWPAETPANKNLTACE